MVEDGRGIFVDLYELTMLRAYAAAGMNEVATFSLFVRQIPESRNVLVTCGLDELLDQIEYLRFGPADIDYLRSLGLFSDTDLEALRAFRFTGDIFAIPEGAPFFPDEPILEIVAPIQQAQVLETLVLNQIGMQTIFASKAARMVAAAAGRPVVDFGARRAQGLDAAIKGVRAFAIAGVAGTSLIAAGARYGIPVTGTMAHSFVEAFASEAEAFEAFARVYPRTVLLVDTYDTLEGVRNAIALARKIGSDCRLTGVRLDSGDLDALSRAARAMLDEAGLRGLKIVASGGLTEQTVDKLVRAGAPIDMFGVGTEMSVSGDAPSLDIAYKLTEYAGQGRMKLSARKSTMPGRKQVWRETRDGVAIGDVIGRFDESHPGTPLLRPVMRGGRRVAPRERDLTRLRAQAVELMKAMPREFAGLARPERPYTVVISDRLRADTAALRARLAAEAGRT